MSTSPDVTRSRGLWGVLGGLVAVSGLLVAPGRASSAAGTSPATPISVTAAQADAAPDLSVRWAPSSAGTPATGAVVQLYEDESGKYVFLTQVTCGGGCTSAVFRELSFGSTYEAAVFPTNAEGTGSPGASGAVRLATLCPDGACITFNANEPIGPANQAAAGILHSVYPVGNDQADLEALKTPIFRDSPLPNGNGTFNWSSWNVAVAAGAQTTLVLSDEYSAAYGGSPPTPWSNWVAYNAEITTLVRELMASGEPIGYWEVYNEPGGNDNYYSAAGYATETPALLLQQFLSTYDDIRTVVPNAQIIGPSLEHWRTTPASTAPATIPSTWPPSWLSRRPMTCSWRPSPGMRSTTTWGRRPRRTPCCPP